MKLPKLEMQDYLVLAALGGLAYLWYKKETAPALASAAPSSGAPRTGTTTVTTPNAPAQVQPSSPASSVDPGIGSTIFSNSSGLPGFGDS